jgi:hypothetical protein
MSCMAKDNNYSDYYQHFRQNETIMCTVKYKKTYVTWSSRDS